MLTQFSRSYTFPLPFPPASGTLPTPPPPPATEAVQAEPPVEAGSDLSQALALPHNTALAAGCAALALVALAAASSALRRRAEARRRAAAPAWAAHAMSDSAPPLAQWKPTGRSRAPPAASEAWLGQSRRRGAGSVEEEEPTPAAVPKPAPPAVPPPAAPAASPAAQLSREEMRRRMGLARSLPPRPAVPLPAVPVAAPAAGPAKVDAPAAAPEKVVTTAAEPGGDAALEAAARLVRERAARRVASRRGLDAHTRGAPLGNN